MNIIGTGGKDEGSVKVGTKAATMKRRSKRKGKTYSLSLFIF